MAVGSQQHPMAAPAEPVKVREAAATPAAAVALGAEIVTVAAGIQVVHQLL